MYNSNYLGCLSGLDVACLTGVVSLVLLVVAFASPYWLVSWEDTRSPFVRSGQAEQSGTSLWLKIPDIL